MRLIKLEKSRRRRISLFDYRVAQFLKILGR